MAADPEGLTPTSIRAAADLRLHLLLGLQPGAAERAEVDRVIDHVGLVLPFRVKEANRHVEHAGAIDRKQRLEVLARQRILETFATAAELSARIVCRHLPLFLCVRPPPPASRPWQP